MKKVGNKKTKGKSVTQRRALLFICVMLIPALYAMFRYVWVNSNSILIAFCDGEVAEGNWTFKWFMMFFGELRRTDTPIFRAMMNTFKCFGLGLLKLFLAYVMAYFLYKKVFFYKGFRFIFFLPSIISPLITIAIFSEIIAPLGPIDIWTGMKETYPALLSSPDTAMSTILFYSLIWGGFGTNFLILMGAMNRIPQEFLEAAEMDGCKAWTEFWLIITPLVWENFSTLLILQLTGIFMASGPILYFTGGSGEPYTLSFWIFDQVRGNSYNYPAAVGMFFTIIAIPFVFGVRWLVNRINPEVSY